jgi:hypothetical protein
VVDSSQNANRVLLVGPPLAGKRTIVEAIAAVTAARLSRFEHQERGFRNVGCYVTLAVEGRAFRIATFSGSVSSPDVWIHYAARAAMILLVLDSQAAQASSNVAMIGTMIGVASKVQNGVLLTKCDLTGASSLDDNAREALRALGQFDPLLFACQRPTGEDGAESVLRWLRR